VSFFLPWETDFLGPQSGLRFAMTTKSYASGLPLWPIFIVLLSAVACLVFSVIKMKSTFSNKAISTAQIAVAILGLLPFIYLLVEISYWTAGFTLNISLWVNILGMLGVLVGAIWSIKENVE
jgi:hypothetical protein